MARKRPPATIEQYLAPLASDKRAALQKLRKAIRAALPSAEEGISYGVPTFRVRGKPIVWFGAGLNHCSFYPGAALEEFADDLEGFDTSKGTIRFQPDRPIPAMLVRDLVKARLARVEAARVKTPEAPKRRSRRR